MGEGAIGSWEAARFTAISGCLSFDGGRFETTGGGRLVEQEPMFVGEEEVFCVLRVSVCTCVNGGAETDS